MRWFGRGRDQNKERAREVSELLDQYHHRASLSDGDRMIVAPGKVLENIGLAMERIDNDINTPVSIEEDVASTVELMSLVENMGMGATLATHAANTALKIMSARYPAELVHNPLPPKYDLRQIAPIALDDQEHEVAKAIFNRRTVSAVDLTEDDVYEDLEPLDVPQQLSVFVALVYMFGTKVGALKSHTGID